MRRAPERLFCAIGEEEKVTRKIEYLYTSVTYDTRITRVIVRKEWEKEKEKLQLVQKCKCLSDRFLQMYKKKLVTQNVPKFKKKY